MPLAIDGGGDLADFGWQRAAIGVAEHDPARAGVVAARRQSRA